MPHRVFGLGLLLAGLVIVAGLLLLRRDLRSAAARGPAWKRRLVTAGLAALAALGVLPTPARHAAAAPVAASEAQPSSGPQRALEAHPTWQRVAATRAEAAEIASGRKGSFPFDEAGRTRILAALDAAREDADALAAEGLLAGAEAALLKEDLATLRGRVSGFRPTELREATCYKPMMLRHGHDGWVRLRARLPLLEKLAGEATLHPVVVQTLLESVRADIALLENPKESRDLTYEEREAATAGVADAKAQVERIERRLSSAGVALEDRAEWQRVAAILDEAEEIASGKRGAYPFDADGKERVLTALTAAQKDTEALAQAGALLAPEADLLKAHLATLHGRVGEFRPTSLLQATCYEPMPMRDGHDGWERLRARLPLLEKLAAAKRLHPAVVRELLDALQADIALLEDDGRSRDLEGPDRKGADRDVTAAKAAVARIEKKLPAPEPK